MSAFAVAVAAGADGVELDVHLSRDGVPIVIHDATLERTTNGRGAVAATDLSVLRRLDAGSWFASRFAGEKLPTLAEVLDFISPQLRVNIEIKDTAAAAALLSLLPQFPRGRFVVSSFDHRVLLELNRHLPQLPLGFLLERRWWRSGAQRAATVAYGSLHPPQAAVSATMVATCRELGLPVYPWTVDDPARILALRQLGVAGVFTNDPAGVRAALAPL